MAWRVTAPKIRTRSNEIHLAAGLVWRFFGRLTLRPPMCGNSEQSTAGNCKSPRSHAPMLSLARRLLGCRSASSCIAAVAGQSDDEPWLDRDFRGTKDVQLCFVLGRLAYHAWDSAIWGQETNAQASPFVFFLPQSIRTRSFSELCPDRPPRLRISRNFSLLQHHQQCHYPPPPG